MNIMRTLFFILPVLFGLQAFAGLALQGKLEDPGTTTPIANLTGINLAINYYNNAQTCLLASESFSGVSTDSDGNFEIALGTGSFSPTVGGQTLDDIFNNLKSYGC
jgi:hypothetical protein